jgi:AcrR family transcriptional regulator
MSPRDAVRTREALLEVAFEEIYRRGFHESSLADILARTEVTKGALYHHFGSKEELGLAVLDEVIGAWLREYKIRPFEESDDPVAVLTQMIAQETEALPERAVKQGCPLGNMSQELSACHDAFRQHIEALYDEWRGAIASCVRRGQAAGKVREDVDADAVGTFVVAVNQGLAQLMKNQGNIEPVATAQPLLLDWLHSLKPRRER